MKEFPVGVALTLASGGIAVADGCSFANIHEAITHVLGRDVWTHELADMSVWEEAAANVNTYNPELAFWGNRLNKTPEDHVLCLAGAKETCGETIMLPQGLLQPRTETPLESLQRIAPHAEVLVIEVEP